MVRRAGLLFLLLIVSALGVQAATLHGTIYDPSLNLIRDAQLEINTTPKQHMISKTGGYFFYAPLGVYEISAEKYQQGSLIYSTKEIVQVDKDGEFNIDIIMGLMPGVELIPEKEPSVSPMAYLMGRYGKWLYTGIIVIILMTLLVVYSIHKFFFKKSVKSAEKEKVVEQKKKKIISPKKAAVKATKESNAKSSSLFEIFMPHEVEHSVQIQEIKSMDETGDAANAGNMPELDDIICFIKEEGNRTTQKDIRKKFPLSEAKISLMIAELESKGKVEKIKKGRGNIIVLKEVSHS